MRFSLRFFAAESGRAESRKIPEVVHLLFALHSDLSEQSAACGFDGGETLAFLFSEFL
jgi:hypothetical protein